MGAKSKAKVDDKSERKARKKRQAERGIRIPESLLARLRPRRKSRRLRLEAPTFKLTPGVGTEPTQVAHDAACKFANDWLGGLGGDFGQGLGALSFFGEDLYFPGYQVLAQLTQKAEFRRPSEIIAKTMTRRGFKFVTTGDKDKSKTIAKLEAAVRKHKILAKLRKVAEQDGYFGRSQIYIDTGDGDRAEELNKPLSLSKAKIRKGQKLEFRVVEPMWSYPQAYDTMDPLSPTFYRPDQWFVMQKAVHHTRLLTFVSREVPDILKPLYMFGGLSLSQMAMVYVDNWLKTQQNVNDLIRNFSVMGLKTDLSNLTQPGNQEEFDKRMELFNLLRDNGGLFALDKNKEDFFNTAAPLAGLDKLQAQSQEHMAAVCGIPLVVFFGITPSGLNASSDGEIRAYYDWIKALQEQFFTPHLETIIGLIQLNLFGRIDPEIHIEWEPLWQLDDAALASVQKTKADTDAVLIGCGTIDPEDSRRRLAADDQSDYHGINPDDVPEPPDDGTDPDGEGGPSGDPEGDPAKSAEPKKAERSGV